MSKRCKCPRCGALNPIQFPRDKHKLSYVQIIRCHVCGLWYEKRVNAGLMPRSKRAVFADVNT